MKNRKKKSLPGPKWIWILLIQWFSMLLAGAVISLSIWLGGFIHGLFLWVIAPLTGFISACLATRRGLLNYAAWIAPPSMQFLANLLIWGYAPSAAPVFLCGFISLVGAATGEVLKRQDQSQRRTKWKKI